MISGNFAVGFRDKAVYSDDIVRSVSLDVKRLGKLHRSLSRLNGVDDVRFDFVNIVVAHVALECDDFCRRYCRALTCRKKLNALRRAVCALVVLARQIFCSKIPPAVLEADFVAYVVLIGFREYLSYCAVEFLGAESLCVVSVDYA